MNKKILVGLEFNTILSESMAQTQTGADLINKYKSFLMANESSYSLVNNFIKEARMCLYDNGVNRIVEQIADYISMNKTSWALATACEQIYNSNASYNYINRNAAKQVDKLLEMEEDEVVKYIKAGALKNVMFCESFRNIAKQVYKDTPVVEAYADYTITHPISMIENAGDGMFFEACGAVYKLDDDRNIQEAQWSDVSNTFRTVSQMLESNMTTIDSDTITVKVGNHEYIIKESDKVTKISHVGQEETKVEMTSEQMRDNNRLMLATTNPRFKNQMAGLLEAVALISENYSQIVSLDNVSVVSSKNDRFVVIESNSNLYATLLQSNHSAGWSINENAIEALSFIKSKTNVSLSENYTELVSNCVAEASAENQEQIQKEIKEQEISSLRKRVEILTEKFKNDPCKLLVLSQVAEKISSLEK